MGTATLERVGFGHFMRTAGRHEVLSAEEEANLAKRIVAGRTAEAQVEAASRYASAHRKRFDQIAKDGREAERRLISQNVRLVVSYAKNYLPPERRRSLEFEDLVQEGMLGLMRAIDKFDPTRGFKFSTYATWWIRQHIERGIADKGLMIRLPVHVQESLRKLWKARSELTASGAELTAENLAYQSEMSVSTVEELLKVEPWLQVSRFEAVVGDNGSLGDFIMTPERDPTTVAVDREAVSATVRHALAELDERSAKILMLRFGLAGGEAMTLDEVGQHFGLTRERIRQLQGKALEQMGRKSWLVELL